MTIFHAVSVMIPSNNMIVELKLNTNGEKGDLKIYSFTPDSGKPDSGLIKGTTHWLGSPGLI